MRLAYAQDPGCRNPPCLILHEAYFQISGLFGKPYRRSCNLAWVCIHVRSYLENRLNKISLKLLGEI